MNVGYIAKIIIFFHFGHWLLLFYLVCLKIYQYQCQNWIPCYLKLKWNSAIRNFLGGKLVWIGLPYTTTSMQSIHNLIAQANTIRGKIYDSCKDTLHAVWLCMQIRLGDCLPSRIFLQIVENMKANKFNHIKLIVLLPVRQHD